MKLVKSKQRVSQHGEVFTPSWLVDEMLSQVAVEADRIDSRFLEPACGSGNFLVPVLQRKLATVHSLYGKNDFENRHQAIYALMNVYGIELLSDNIEECRQNLLEVFVGYLGISSDHRWVRAAATVLQANIIHGNALEMVTDEQNPIRFAEWGYLGKGQFQRRDFLYGNLTQRSSFENTLFEGMDVGDIFTPVKTYPKMTIEKLIDHGESNC